MIRRTFLALLCGLVLAAAVASGGASASTAACSAASPALLFYKPGGDTLTGFYDQCNTFRYPHRYALAAGWTHASSAGGGRILFYDTATGAAATGSLDFAGTYTPLRSDLRLKPGWSVVAYAGFLQMLIFYDAASGATSTGIVGSDGRYRNLQDFTLAPGWTSIATSGYTPDGRSGVFFYNATTGAAASALLGSDGSYTKLKDLRVAAGWTQVIGTGRTPCGGKCTGPSGAPILLFYNAVTGAASTGQVLVDGGYRNLRNTRLDRGWTSVTRNGTYALSDFGGTHWNGVFFYNAANGYASRGRIVAASCCSTHPLGEYVFPRDAVGFPTGETLVVAP